MTILIRHGAGRKTMFLRCLDSIEKQTKKPSRVIVSVEGERPDYIPSWVETIRVTPNKEAGECFYNLYCNDLMEQVKDDWFFFLDDDDVLHHPRVLKRLERHCLNKALVQIVQFERHSGARLFPKPSNADIAKGIIRSGYIGMPCIILHSWMLPNLPRMGAKDNSDFVFIKQVYDSMPCEFLKIIVVSSPQRSYGKNYGDY
jgi:hypothetical protein